jgi:hypothetical protein
MKHLSLITVSLWLLHAAASAQPRPAKLYVADVKDVDEPNPAENKRRNEEIEFQAKKQVRDNLPDILNSITFDGTTETQINAAIENSYLPGSTTQIFENDQVRVEDDIDPGYTKSSDAIPSLVIGTYLRNLDLFYIKSGTPSIKIDQIIPSSVIKGEAYLYIKVFFRQTFGGKYRNDTLLSYRPVNRVAELKAVPLDKGKWRTYITAIRFARPGEGLDILNKPTIAPSNDPEPIDAKLVRFVKADSPNDSLAVRWDDKRLQIAAASLPTVPVGFYQRSLRVTGNAVGIVLNKSDQRLTFRRVDGSELVFNAVLVPEDYKKLIRGQRRLGWFQVAAGLLALGGSYAGYSSLRTAYNQYTARLASLTDEYAVWQSLSQQPIDQSVGAISFSRYAQPGIYGVYGGGAVGSALLLNGIRHLLKAGKLHRKQTQSKSR